MKLMVINVHRNWGTSDKNVKKEGDKPRDYEMFRMTALSPFQSVQMEKYNHEGIGLEPIEPPVAESFYPLLFDRFKQHFKGKPLEWDFSTTLQRRGRGTETVIDGFAVDPGMASPR